MLKQTNFQDNLSKEYISVLIKLAANRYNNKKGLLIDGFPRTADDMIDL